MARNLTARLARLERRLPPAEELVPLTPAERCVIRRNVFRRVFGDVADSRILALKAAVESGDAAACDAAFTAAHEWFVVQRRGPDVPEQPPPRDAVQPLPSPLEEPPLFE